MYIKDLINLITSNFNESGSVLLPDLFSKVVSSDAPFELVISNLARKVRLIRQDIVVGHKRLFYAIDLADETRKSTREVTINFFKKELGFLDSEIEFCDRTKFYEDQDLYKTNFTNED